jgi:PleD family two-component response regulator
LEVAKGSSLEVEMKSRKGRILVVEDDIDTSDMLRAYFEAQGYEVMTAAWGNDALQVCQEALPDLIIQDIRLPDINGYEVIDQLRQDLRTQQIPVIFLTEKRERGDRIAGLKLGAVDYITKPFDMQELRLRVRNALRRASYETLVNPVTGLPGEKVVLEQLNLLPERDVWAVMHVGVVGLAAFNEAYGFVAGDDVLRAVGLIISNVVEEAGTIDDFVGHVDTADFVLITEPSKVEPLQEKLLVRLKRAISYFYPIKDRDQGFIQLKDAAGNERRAPLMSVTVGVITDRSDSFSSGRRIWRAVKRAQGVSMTVN